MDYSLLDKKTFVNDSQGLSLEELWKSCNEKIEWIDRSDLNDSRVTKYRDFVVGLLFWINQSIEPVGVSEADLKDMKLIIKNIKGI